MMRRALCLVGWVLALWCQGALAASDTPAGLEAALRAALSQHPSMAGKRSEVAAKGFVGDSARAQRYPTISAQAASNNHPVSPFAPGSSAQPANVRVRQALWAFGRIDASIAYADADRITEEADLLRVSRQLMDQTAVAYVKVLGARARVALAADNVHSLEILYEQIRRREAGQLASLADVRFGQARLTQARAQQNRYTGDLAVAENDLQSLTQTKVASNVNVSPTVTDLPQANALEDLAMEQGADVKWKQMRVELARADVAREQSAALPTLYLQGDRYINQTATQSNTQVVGVVLEGSIEGMGLASRGRARAAAAHLDAAQDDLSATQLELGRNVRSLSTSRNLQQELMTVQGRSVTELLELLASYQRQYEVGNKSWQDLLNMQRELSDQRLQAAQAESDWLTYTVKLAALTGRLDELAFPDK